MSLFDVAADLSQFAGADGGDELCASGGSDARSALQSRSSALCILDETLQTIYDSSGSKSSARLEQRLRELSAKAPSPAATQPAAGTPKVVLERIRSNSEADMAAKTILRQLNDEVEQLAELQCASGEGHAAANATRFLSEKYIDTQLNTLPVTPFVQLARKKALLKIQQLNRQVDVRAAATPSSPIGAGSELWQRLGALTAPQHALLRQLARVPEAQVGALPPAQQELAHFARRYERVRVMPARDIARLQPHQQQIVRHLQRAATTD